MRGRGRDVNGEGRGATTADGDAVTTRGDLGTLVGRERARPKGPRRIYDTVAVAADGPGFLLQLDGRKARTPGGKVLLVPTHALASALAVEWDAQSKIVDPETMPLTRLANTAIDGVAGREHVVRADIVSYAGSDLVCYRAESPEGLVSAQSASWDPVLDWAHDRLSERFRAVHGIMHVAQGPGALASIARHIEPFDAWWLSAAHMMTTLSGSALLALAHLDHRFTLEQIWRAALVDEDWQISRWGEDREAALRRARRFEDMQAASRLAALLSAMG